MHCFSCQNSGKLEDSIQALSNMRPVCDFCLSRERRLSPPPVRTLPLLAALFSQLSSYRIVNGICWECAAMLRRVLRFQHRAACAQDWLTQATSHQSHEVHSKVKSLSSLCSTINTKYDVTVSLQCGISEFEDNPNVLIKEEPGCEDNFIEVTPGVDTFDSDEWASKYNSASETTQSHENGTANVTCTGMPKKKKQSKKNRENKKENIREKKRRKSKNKAITNSVFVEQENLGLKENTNKCLYQIDIIQNARPTYQCNYCNKIFSSRLRMQKHFKSFVGECLKKQEGARRRIKSGFPCPDCSLKFTYRCNLIEHSRTHTGEKPHECKQCGKRYTQTASLNRHIRTHNEDRRFVCTYCGQRFVEKRTLTDHYNIHTGLRPYLCSECGKSFTQKGALRTHCKTHSAVRVVG